MKKWRMPAEYEPHQGTLMIWPVRPGSWPHDGVAAKRAFCNVIAALLPHETVYLLTDAAHRAEAAQMLPQGVQILEIESDDAWARDVGPTFVLDEQGALTGIDWQFNAWGGDVDGLYPHWERDDAVAAQFCRAIGAPIYDAHPFILEGGSIHSDGAGTLMTTEACLLSAGRNAAMTKAEISETLCSLLGGEKVIWLPRGIYNDETNEHVDNICAFVAPGEVVLAWTDDESDPQYPLSAACLQVLQNQRDAQGRAFLVHKLPIPKTPITVTAADLEGYPFEPGEDVRDVGARLAASYVNFYVGNHVVLVPQFGDDNDAEAVRILSELFPQREIVPIAARDILLGGGNIHCITQQIPKGGSRKCEM